MIRYLYLLSISLFVGHSSWSQASDIIYIHTDKDYYINGSIVYFKAYVTDQSYQLGASDSGVAYVDLINPEGQIMATKTIQITGGSGFGTFELHSITSGGALLLRGYTTVMRNDSPMSYFRKLIYVEDSNFKGEDIAKRSSQDEENIPVEMYDGYNVDIEFDEESYEKRSLVGMAIDLYDDDGESISGQFSLSIVDRYLNKTIAQNKNILTHSLAAKKESGSSGLKSKNKNTSLTYPVEKSLATKGKIHSKKDLKNGKSAFGEMYLLNSGFDTELFRSDENGDFVILKELQFDSVDVLFKVGELQTSKTNIKSIKPSKKLGVHIYDRTPAAVHDISVDIIEDIAFVGSDEIDQKTLDRYEDIFRNENTDFAMSELIEEVYVKADRIPEIVRSYKSTMLYTKPNTRIIAQDLPAIAQYYDIYGILKGRVAGLQFEAPEEPGTKHAIILRGMTTGLSKKIRGQTIGQDQGIEMLNGARFMVNGAFVPTRMAESINPTQIAFVDVISSLSELSLYGEQGYNGIINIYLKENNNIKRPYEDLNSSDFVTATLYGYHQPTAFIHPDYGNDSDKHDDFDSRITLIWEPNVIIDESGSAYLEFYTGDRYTIYDVVLEGITDNGLPVRTTTELIVSND